MRAAARDGRVGRRGRRRIAIGVATGVLLVLAAGAAATVAQLGPAGVGDVVADHAASLVAAVAVVALATTSNLLLRWVRWHGLVRQTGLVLPARSSLVLWTATLPALLTPFSVGELARVALLRRHGRSGRLVVVWLTERSMDLAALGALYLAATGSRLGSAGALAAGLAASLAGVTALNPARRDRQRRALVASVAFALTLLSWAAVASAVPLAADVVGVDPPVRPRDAAEAFAGGTVVGGASGTPLGVAVTGSWMIDRFEERGIGEDAAERLVVAVRGGTAWFAVVLGVVVAVRARRRLREAIVPGGAQGHFDALAPSYAGVIPPHMRDRYVARKLANMDQPTATGRPVRVLDVGCGHGWYAHAVADSGAAVVATDLSVAQLAEAAAARGTRPVALVASRAEALPFRDAAFDGAYAVNSFHHLVAAGAQPRAFAEVARVVRRGGVFHLHEINADNPLFRLYVGYLFPLLRPIDDGTERFISPSRLPVTRDATWTGVAYYDFLPDFLPAWLLRWLAPVERALERSPLRRFSAHYTARMDLAPSPTRHDARA